MIIVVFYLNSTEGLLNVFFKEFEMLFIWFLYNAYGEFFKI